MKMRHSDSSAVIRERVYFDWLSVGLQVLHSEAWGSGFWAGQRISYGAQVLET